MADERSISIHLRDDKEFRNPVWAVRDFAVPATGDTITIESGDESFDTYEVIGRNWTTAKQGESSFTQVRLIVRKLTEPFIIAR